MPQTHADRVLHFDGAKNVRDLGGLPAAHGRRTRRRVIYRADGLSRLTPDDIERLALLGLKTIIDLRYDEERERAPDRAPIASAPTFFHRGFLPQGTIELFTSINERGADADTAFSIMCDNYARMPFDHADELRDVMHHLLEAKRAPCLIHCTSGKDRTGLVSAFILGVVGVSREHVLEDYLLSNGEFQAVDVFGPTARVDAVAIVMAARAEYLLAALDAIDQRCGSFNDYMQSYLHMGERERERLIALLLD